MYLEIYRQGMKKHILIDSMALAAYTLLPTPFHLRLPIPRSQWPVRRPCTQCPVRCVAMGIEAETQTQNIRKPTAKLDEQRRE